MIVIKFRYFLSGILFISFIMPFLEELLNLILTWIEWRKGKLTVGITELNNKIKKLSDEEIPENSYAIGFTASMTEKDDEDDDDL